MEHVDMISLGQGYIVEQLIAMNNDSAELI